MRQATAFLGMTFACARCHDHKYDPILQTDYYRLQAFFANTAFGDGSIPLKDPVERKKYEEQRRCGIPRRKRFATR